MSKRKFLSLALALCLALAMLPTAALAADNDFILKNQVLTKYDGSGGAVTIPNGVTGIGAGAFRGCTSLTSVVIPSSVTSIGSEAFKDCFSLTSVTIPSSVTSIESGAFMNCTGLTSVTIQSGAPRIGEQAFYYCTKLTSVTIPDSVTVIGREAFNDCFALTSVTIPKSVTNIGWDAFGNCTSLTDVYYGGTEDQWKAIVFENLRSPAQTATIHYTAPVKMAYASTQMVTLDGEQVEFQAYALKDANGNDTNYVKLRDVAYALNDTAAQFSVGWDQNAKSISVTSGEAYEPNDTEMKTPYSGDRAYTESSSPLYINGEAADPEAILLKDDAGNGYTYFKLRELGQLLNFNVMWDGSGIVVESDKPYTG